MMKRELHAMASAALAVLVLVLLAACGNGEGDADAGLTRADVQEIVREEMADAPAPPERSPGLTAGEVEEAIRRAMADPPQPEAGLSKGEVERIVEAAVAAAIPEQQAGLITAEEVERIARGVVASIPPRSAPTEYTKFFVDKAISRYDTQGLDATLAHYNRPGSVYGQWYAFVIDESGLVIGHPDAQRLGLDLRGWVGTDANGYNFGPDMLSATEEGKWVSYVYENPESGDFGAGYTGELELKNVWVVRHDGLLFASGWYINADEFTKSLVFAAVNTFRLVGLEGTIAYFSGPESVYSGLAATIEYYNSAENVEGDWFAFIADESGTIVDHYHKDMVGTDISDIFGTDMFEVTAEGNWVTTEDVRVWVVGYDGMTFGSGWHSGHDEAN